MGKDIMIGGHRGSGSTDSEHARKNPKGRSKLPENTLKSIRSAFQNAADFVELDVVFTKDGQIAVLHSNRLSDHFFQRPLPANYARQLTYNELRKLRSGPGKNGVVPLLSEALSTVWRHCNAQNKDGILINIEIKGVKRTADFISSKKLSHFFNELADVVQKGDIPVEKILFSSCAAFELAEMKKRVPHARYAMVFSGDGAIGFPVYLNLLFRKGNRRTSFTKKNIEKVLKITGPLDYAHPEIATLNEEAVKTCKKHNMGINTWAQAEKMPELDKPRIQKAVETCRKYGVPLGLITDFASRMRKLTTRPPSP